MAGRAPPARRAGRGQASPRPRRCSEGLHCRERLTRRLDAWRVEAATARVDPVALAAITPPPWRFWRRSRVAFCLYPQLPFTIIGWTVNTAREAGSTVTLTQWTLGLPKVSSRVKFATR